MQEYVVGFVFHRPTEIVLLQEKLRPKWQNGLYNGVGGKVEIEEDPYDAIEREFKEETGCYFLLSWRMKLILICKNAKVYFFTSEVANFSDLGKITELSKDHTHDEKCILVEIDELDRVVHNLRWIIPFCCGKDQYNLVTVEEVECLI